MEEKAITQVNGKETNLQEVTQIAREYLNLVGQKVKPEDAVKFLNICKAYGFNPFKREIYLIPYGNQANIIVGYEVYLKRAERSGKLAGWRVWTEGSLEKGDLKACIEIRRKDWDSPFYHEVYFSEYNQNNTIWKSKPITMIKKVAIAQGFRLCFPEELGGMPYTKEEIPTVVDTEIVKEEPKQIENKANGWTWEKIQEVVTDELKQTVRQYQIKLKELIELFNEFDGDQAAIINKIKEMKEGQKEAVNA